MYTPQSYLLSPASTRTFFTLAALTFLSLPGLGQVSSVTCGTDLLCSPNPITGSGTISLYLQGNITGSPSLIADRVDFGTRSMSSAPSVGQESNRLALVASATGQLGAGLGSEGGLMHLSLTGASSYSYGLLIDHTNTSGIGDSTGLSIRTAGSYTDVSAGLDISNTGVADALHINVSPTTTTPWTVTQPTGIGIDLNVNNNPLFAGAAIRIANHGSGGNSYAYLMDLHNSGTDVSPQIVLHSNGNNLWIMPNDDSTPNGSCILVRDAAFANDKFSVTLDGAVMAAKSLGQNSVTWKSSSGAPSGSCATGSLYTDKSATSATAALYVCVNSAWVAR